MLLGNQQRSIMLSAGVDSIAPDTEWNFFAKLNHLIPKDTPPKDPDQLEYAGRDDPLTVTLKEGMLERQSSWIKSWKSAFYLLTPSGFLHSYPTSSSPIGQPASSLNLRLCTLGPMPTPETSNDQRGQLEALFTLDGPDGKHVLRAKSWEELSSWWGDIEKVSSMHNSKCKRKLISKFHQ